MRTWPVGRLKPNGRGLFDMHGNVHESCNNIYEHAPAYRADTGETRPLRDGVETVARGGSFPAMRLETRSANRRGANPMERIGYSFGFRVARTLQRP